MRLGRGRVRWVVALGGGLWALAAGPALALAASPPPPTITLTAISGPVRTPLTIEGKGFPPNELVALYIDEPSVYIGTPGPLADAQGAFHKSITWPGADYDVTGQVNPSTPGVHTICGDTSYPGHAPPLEAKACAQFIVTSSTSPSPQPSPAAGGPGGASLGEILVVGAILVLVAAGTVMWMRRSP